MRDFPPAAHDRHGVRIARRPDVGVARAFLFGVAIGVLAVAALAPYGCAAAGGSQGPEPPATGSHGRDALVVAPDGSVTLEKVTVSGALHAGSAAVGELTTAGGTLTLDSATVKGTLTTEGQATLASAEVRGSLTAKGALTATDASLHSARITGDVGVGGKLTAPGMVSGAIFMVGTDNSAHTLHCEKWGAAICPKTQDSMFKWGCEKGSKLVELARSYCNVYGVTSNGYCRSALCITE